MMAVFLLTGLFTGALTVWIIMFSREKSLRDASESKAQSLTRAARSASSEASALRNEVALFQQNIQKSEDLMMLFPEMLKLIFRGKDAREAVTFLNRACANLLKADETAVFLSNRTGSRLDLTVSTGLHESVGVNASLGIGEGFTGLAAETGRLLDRESLDRESILVRRNMISTDIPGFKPDLAAPMTSEGVLYGVITAGGFKENNPVRKATLRALAAVGAAALENVNVLERLGKYSEKDTETGFCRGSSLDSVLKNELDRVERLRTPLAVMELVIESASEEPNVSRDLMGAASSYISSALRVIDLAIRTGQGEVMILLPGIDQKGLESVTAKLGRELPAVVTEAGVTVGKITVRGCVVDGGSGISVKELHTMLSSGVKKEYSAKI